MENGKTKPVLTGTLQVKIGETEYETTAKVALWLNNGSPKSPKYKGTVKYGSYNKAGEFAETGETSTISIWEQ